MDNFNYFALKYLNDWHLWDKPFSERISSELNSDSREALHEAAKYYKVTRNFSILDSEKDERLQAALNLLLKIDEPVMEDNVCSIVTTLADDFKIKYSKNAVSAASKFLWLRFKSPVVIFDSRAIAWLRNNGYEVPHSGGYKEYREQWIAAFNDNENKISSACSKLENVKEYSLAFEYSKKDIKELSKSRWFKERVFDKYLWFNSNND